MFLFRKNIILVPENYDGINISKGLLSLDCYDNITNCTLKTYNLDSTQKLLFGVAVNGKLFKFNVPEYKVRDFEFDLNIAINNNDEISCVLVNMQNNNYDILLWGSTQINKAWQSMLKMMIEDETTAKQNVQTWDFVNKTKEQEKQPAKLYRDTEKFDNSFEKSSLFNKTYNNDFDDRERNNLQTSVFSSIGTENDELEKYIDKVIELAEDDKNELGNENFNESKSNNNTEKINSTFYERIYPQIKKMLNDNESEKVLEEILPNSKFCKVRFDDEKGYYVFGIIYEDETPKYICYGVPAKKTDAPPDEMSELYQWMPIDASNADGDGFYMMYQDAKSGENISVDII